ncbi:MAG: dicarboxylate/amino acid:cation symporter [Alistipes sp.]|nr:dicarboxylate/amino acid:cation symporter [Alistipes sp.]
MKHKFGLLPKVLLAIALGIGCGLIVPGWIARIALTFNALFGNFLNFVIPLLILGLVAPGIAELGAKAGRLLAVTAALAYAFTLFSGFGTLFASLGLLPRMLGETTPVIAPDDGGGEALRPFFTVDMPPLMGVMTALLLAFVLGLGMARIRNGKLKGMMDDFKQIIERVIARVILPLLPFYIFGIFLSITQSGQVAGILGIFLKLIVVIFLMTVVLLLIQFSIAGAVARKNPFGMLRTMLTAYMTALGTQSSAATIPVTLAQTVKLGVRPEVAGFVIPLCATIHLSGSMMKITACSVAVLMLTGADISLATYAGFILLLGITMIAAPGVPGGAIMAAVGLLESMLGFDDNMIGLMIATYIAMDSFGTAANVTGDGAIAVIVNAIDGPRRAA